MAEAKGSSRTTTKAPTRRTGVREAAAQATRDSILRAATKVFAKYGYDGGSVEKISKAAHSYDRMIYYYFGSKEGLFIAVIEGIYRRMDEAEAALELDESRLVEALTEFIRFVLGYYRRHPDLSATTDSLFGVPPSVVDRIVDVAFEVACTSYVANSPELGEAVRRRRVLAEERLFAQHRPDPARPQRLLSHDRRRVRFPSGPSDPDIFHTP